MVSKNIINPLLPNTIEVHPIHTVTRNTPNSKFPVLVYRSVLNQEFIDNSESEKDYQELINKIYVENGWRALDTFGAVTLTHYHPNVHECYAVLKGSSTYFLGLDVTYIPERLSESEISELPPHLEITVRKGDVLLLPAGVSHCSQVKDKEFRYLACYPTNGEKWTSKYNFHIEKCKPNKYDNAQDIEIAKKVPFPTGDPIYGTTPGTLMELWNKYNSC